jgi:hypothetical protein
VCVSIASYRGGDKSQVLLVEESSHCSLVVTGNGIEVVRVALGLQLLCMAVVVRINVSERERERANQRFADS